MQLPINLHYCEFDNSKIDFAERCLSDVWQIEKLRKLKSGNSFGLESSVAQFSVDISST